MFSPSGFNAVELAVWGLAAWRLAHLLMWERGPFNLLVGLRHLVGIEQEDGVPTVYPDNVIARLLQCVFCLSIWTAGLTLILWLVIPWGWIPVTVLGISGLAVIIDGRTN